jgi:uncharacterized damage-inducible protein DinB
MSLRAQYCDLARYNTWMNRRLYGHAASLPEAERSRDRGAFFGSIHGTLNHLLLADRTWLARFTGDRERFVSRDAAGAPIPVTSLAQVLYADFAELAREREATDAAIEAWSDSLDDDRLQGQLVYKSMGGVPQGHPMWWAVSHFFNHQTHHRGQVTTLLFQAGIDPGVTDLVAFLREQAAAR